MFSFGPTHEATCCSARTLESQQRFDDLLQDSQVRQPIEGEYLVPNVPDTGLLLISVSFPVSLSLLAPSRTFRKP